MSLFRQLQRLYRPEKFQFEDFHTEIVAQVLQNSPALTLSWLKAIGATNLSKTDHIDVRTQRTLEPLVHHSTASRPDTAILLSQDAKRELIFVESKQDSVQGYGQLQRYAEHLDAARQKEGFDNVVLVYITRDYEAAEIALSAAAQLYVSFRRTRWFQFYEHLKVHLNGDGLAKELKLFMEENRMSLGHQFRSSDLVALENFFSAKALMDETLEGEVSEAVGKLPGGLFAARRGLKYFRDDHRYVASNNNWMEIECHVGYWLPHEKPDEGVWVGVTLYSTPSAAARNEIIAAFRAWLQKGSVGWESEDLDDPRAKSSIYKGKVLQSLMAGPDHVHAIKEFLLSLLKEVELFRQNNRHLGWCEEDQSDHKSAIEPGDAESER